jgi:hypothetical protein
MWPEMVLLGKFQESDLEWKYRDSSYHLMWMRKHDADSALWLPGEQDLAGGPHHRWQGGREGREALALHYTLQYLDWRPASPLECPLWASKCPYWNLSEWISVGNILETHTSFTLCSVYLANLSHSGCGLVEPLSWATKGWIHFQWVWVAPTGPIPESSFCAHHPPWQVHSDVLCGPPFLWSTKVHYGCPLPVSPLAHFHH